MTAMGVRTEAYDDLHDNKPRSEQDWNGIKRSGIFHSKQPINYKLSSVRPSFYGAGET